MSFYSDRYNVPELLQTEEFMFRPLRASDVELDFDAVVSSSSMLRCWSQSEWPRDGFTLEENLEDLRRHEQEHLDKKAFTYTIMNQKETFCLGCIYITPPDREEQDLVKCRNMGGDDEPFIASVRFWVRESQSSPDFNTEILEAIVQWLETAWYFTCVVFSVAVADSMQNSMLNEIGMSPMGGFVFGPQKSSWNIYQKEFSG
jgi:hypothetical protein